MSALLKVDGVRASVADKEILKGMNLEVNKGEVHVIMGPNGSGKSTLANVIMANPAYAMTEGKIYFEGEDISEESTDKRARRGLYLSFQTPYEIPGISVENFIRQALLARGKKTSIIKFKKELQKKMELLDMKPEYAERYLNVGFSGGERKKNGNITAAYVKSRTCDIRRNRLGSRCGRCGNGKSWLKRVFRRQ